MGVGGNRWEWVGVDGSRWELVRVGRSEWEWVGEWFSITRFYFV